MGESYLLVQWRSDGEWLVGKRANGEAHWSSDKSIAARFVSQKEFREWHMITFGHKVNWRRDDLRFVRVTPRRPS